nr:uncharacterized protein LOC124811357 [Hydra vulgaris]
MAVKVIETIVIDDDQDLEFQEIDLTVEEFMKKLDEKTQKPTFQIERAEEPKESVHFQVDKKKQINHEEKYNPQLILRALERWLNDEKTKTLFINSNLINTLTELNVLIKNRMEEPMQLKKMAESKSKECCYYRKLPINIDEFLEHQQKCCTIQTYDCFGCGKKINIENTWDHECEFLFEVEQVNPEVNKTKLCMICQKLLPKKLFAEHVNECWNRFEEAKKSIMNKQRECLNGPKKKFSFFKHVYKRHFKQFGKD